MGCFHWLLVKHVRRQSPFRGLQICVKVIPSSHRSVRMLIGSPKIWLMEASASESLLSKSTVYFVNWLGKKWVSCQVSDLGQQCNSCVNKQAIQTQVKNVPSYNYQLFLMNRAPWQDRLNRKTQFCAVHSIGHLNWRHSTFWGTTCHSCLSIWRLSPV